MTQLEKECTHLVHPEKSPNGIESFSYTYGEEYVHVRALVEDAVLVRSATWLEPEEYGSAVCETEIFWGDPITPETAPKQSEIEEMLSMGHICDWEIVEMEEYEPTDDEMMSAFGTKWHDGL